MVSRSLWLSLLNDRCEFPLKSSTTYVYHKGGDEYGGAEYDQQKQDELLKSVERRQVDSVQAPGWLSAT